MGPPVVLVPVAASLGVLVSQWRGGLGSLGPYPAPDPGRAAWEGFDETMNETPKPAKHV